MREVTCFYSRNLLLALEWILFRGRGSWHAYVQEKEDITHANICKTKIMSCFWIWETTVMFNWLLRHNSCLWIHVGLLSLWLTVSLYLKMGKILCLFVGQRKLVPELYCVYKYDKYPVCFKCSSIVNKILGNILHIEALPKSWW